MDTNEALEHVQAALAGPGMLSVAGLAAAFVNRDVDFLKTQLDVDYAYWAAKWHSESPASDQSEAPEDAPTLSSKSKEAGTDIGPSDALKRMSAAHRKRQRK